MSGVHIKFRWAAGLIVVYFAIIIPLLLASDNTMAQSSPRLSVVGNKGVCSLSSGKTFRFVGKGFTPGGKAMVLVFYPKGKTFPFGNAPNPHGFYWYHYNFGVYPVNSKGSFKSALWDCRFGPSNTQDFTGKYTVMGIDLSTQRKISFRVRP